MELAGPDFVFDLGFTDNRVGSTGLLLAQGLRQVRQTDEHSSKQLSSPRVSMASSAQSLNANTARPTEPAHENGV